MEPFSRTVRVRLQKEEQAGLIVTSYKRWGRAERLWIAVMREGKSIQDVATQYSVPAIRVERILLALGRRRASLLRG